jgi:hypothetical protein
MTPLDALLARDTAPEAGEILTATIRTIRRFAEKHGKDTGTFQSADESAMQRLCLMLAMETFKRDLNTYCVLAALFDMTALPTTEDDAWDRHDALIEAARDRAKGYLSLVEVSA